MDTSADVSNTILSNVRYEGGTKNEPNECKRRGPRTIVHLLCFFASVFKLQTEAFFESQTFTGGAEMRVKITLACTECKQRNYDTTKNKKNDPDRLEMQKYCKFCRKHTLHKETK